MEEIPLMDYGKNYANIEFEIWPRKNGINISSFEIEGEKMLVKDRLQYKAWQWGLVNPGAGQVGMYHLVAPNGSKRFALIKDYRGHEGDWRIFLESIYPNKGQLEQKIRESDLAYLIE